MMRLGIAAGAAVAAFMFTLLLTGLASRYTALAPAQVFLPATQVAEARIITRFISPDIESTLKISLNYRHVTAAGRIHCTAGEQVRLDVTITQETTGAQATGHSQHFCTGEVQTWTAKAVARGATVFELGAAEACAIAVTRLHGKVTDAFSWCRTVTLVPK